MSKSIPKIIPQRRTSLYMLLILSCVQPMKADIFEAGTKYQIGGCPGQRTVFHLFVVKSNIARMIMIGKGVILTLLNLIKFFDKQSLVDACDALH